MFVLIKKSSATRFPNIVLDYLVQIYYLVSGNFFFELVPLLFIQIINDHQLYAELSSFLGTASKTRINNVKRCGQLKVPILTTLRHAAQDQLCCIDDDKFRSLCNTIINVVFSLFAGATP